MIKTKDDLMYYLECDRRALGISYKRPRIFTDEVWRFQRSLRRLEYYTNSGRGGDFRNDGESAFS